MWTWTRLNIKVLRNMVCVISGTFLMSCVNVALILAIRAHFSAQFVSLLYSLTVPLISPTLDLDLSVS